MEVMPEVIAEGCIQVDLLIFLFFSKIEKYHSFCIFYTTVAQPFISEVMVGIFKFNAIIFFLNFDRRCGYDLNGTF